MTSAPAVITRRRSRCRRPWVVRAPPSAPPAALATVAHPVGRVRGPVARARPASLAPRGVRGPHGLSGSHRGHRQLFLLQLVDGVLNLSIVERPGDPRRRPRARRRHKRGLLPGCSAVLVDLLDGSLAALGLADLDRQAPPSWLGPRVWLPSIGSRARSARCACVNSYGLFAVDDDDAARDRRRGQRRRRRLAAIRLPLQARRRQRAGRASSRRTSRGSTGRCGSPRSGIRRAWFCSFLGAPARRLARRARPARRESLLRRGHRATSARSSTTIASPTSARTARTGAYWVRRRMGLYVPVIEARPRSPALG